MKAAATLLLLFWAVLASASDALILIRPDRAEPIVAEENYLHGEWILWPPVDNPGSPNRIMSLLSGADWSAPKNLLNFRAAGSTYISSAYEELKRSGYFQARAAIVDRASGVIQPSPELVSPSALLLGLGEESPGVTPLGATDPLPPLVLAEASSWDEVQAVVNRVGGRVLVVEYPPPDQKRWTRFWLRGSGWGKRLPAFRPWGVPGLIPASEAGNLLLHPESFDWSINHVADWGGANRWLAFVAHNAPFVFSVLISLAVFFFGCAVYLLSREEPARFAGTALKYFLLLPASILLAGRLTVALGRSGSEAWLLLSFVALIVLSQLLASALKSALPKTHPLFGIALIGFVATFLSDPLWSLYSNVLGIQPLPLSPEAVAALGGYLTMVCGFSRGLWIGPILSAAVLLWGAFTRPWWVGSEWTMLTTPVVALTAGAGWFRLWQIPVALVLPLADGRLLRHGLAWAPGNLLHRFAQKDALNLARHVEFLASPGFLLTIVIGGTLAIFVERFFLHEIRRTLRTDRRTQALFHASFLFAALGFVQPFLLYTALACFVGGVLVLLSDTARTL